MHFKTVLAHLKSKIFSVGQPWWPTFFHTETCWTHIFVLGPPLLSMISSVYKLFGFAALFIFEGKRILQGLYNQDIKWDSVVSGAVKKDWKNWVTKLKHIERLHIWRCMKPDNFSKLVNVSLYHFSDASELGYGQWSYIRIVNEKARVHCSLSLGSHKKS